jgi:hypothetical protein
MTAVPFTVGHLYGGFGQCDGLLRDEGEHLALEFQIKDALAGILKTGIRQTRIPTADLVSVTLTKGWLGNTWLGVTITLQAARMETFKDLPGATQGRLELRVARKDSAAAERFVAGLHEHDEAGEA